MFLFAWLFFFNYLYDHLLVTLISTCWCHLFHCCLMWLKISETRTSNSNWAISCNRRCCYNKMPPTTGWNLDFIFFTSTFIQKNQQSLLQENSRVCYMNPACVYNKHNIQYCVQFCGLTAWGSFHAKSGREFTIHLGFCFNSFNELLLWFLREFTNVKIHIPLRFKITGPQILMTRPTMGHFQWTTIWSTIFVLCQKNHWFIWMTWHFKVIWTTIQRMNLNYLQSKF